MGIIQLFYTPLLIQPMQDSECLWSERSKGFQDDQRERNDFCLEGHKCYFSYSSQIAAAAAAAAAAPAEYYCLSVQDFRRRSPSYCRGDSHSPLLQSPPLVFVSTGQLANPWYTSSSLG